MMNTLNIENGDTLLVSIDPGLDSLQVGDVVHEVRNV